MWIPRYVTVPPMGVPWAHGIPMGPWEAIGQLESHGPWEPQGPMRGEHLHMGVCGSPDVSWSTCIGTLIGNQPKFFSCCKFVEFPTTDEIQTNTNPSLTSLRSGHFVCFVCFFCVFEVFTNIGNLPGFLPSEEVFPYKGVLPSYGESSQIWGVFPDMGRLPMYGTSSHMYVGRLPI